MTDLPDFLLARIAEDEAVARRAAPGPWEYQDVDSVGGGRVCDPTVEIANMFCEQPGTVDPRIRREVHSDEADGTGWHIARHDPARVLAECEAKREIVAAYHRYREEAGVRPDESWTGYEAMETTLRLLAHPYRDHPDHNPGWRA